MSEAEFRKWYYNIPFFTKYWLTLTIAFSLLSNLDFFSYHHFILDIRPVIYDYQIWRPVSALFYYPLNIYTAFHFLMNCMILYTYSVRLETEAFKGKTSDYLCMLLFNWISCVIIAFLIHFPLVMDAMVMSVVVVYCQLHPYAEVSSIFRFKNRLFPWVLMVFHMVVNKSGVMAFFGLVVGLLSHYLVFDWPQHKGPALLAAPKFLKRWFGEERRTGEFEPAQPPRPGHLWGKGHPLANKHCKFYITRAFTSAFSTSPVEDYEIMAGWE